jgi:hypothetical protein
VNSQTNPVTVRCLACGNVGRVAGDLAGRAVSCKRCKSRCEVLAPPTHVPANAESNTPAASAPHRSPRQLPSSGAELVDKSAGHSTTTQTVRSLLTWRGIAEAAGLVVLGLIAFCGVVLVFGSLKCDSSPKHGDKIGARAAAEGLVRMQLWSPATARFDTQVADLGGGKYSVSGWVDSDGGQLDNENRPGITVRTHFSFDLQHVHGATYRPASPWVESLR